MRSLPILVTAKLTFDSWSDKLTEGESAIVFEVEEIDGGAWDWQMMSVDNPRLIKHTFHAPPHRVFKSWLIPAA